MPVIEHPNTVSFWYPANVALANASISVTIKAPEYGDSYVEGRNVTINQTRSGATIVYDHGTPFSKGLSLQFRNIPDSERSALVTLFEAVGWGTTPLGYLDYAGNTKTVRLTSNRIDVKSQGCYNYSASQLIYTFDFDIDLVDITGNIIESGDFTLLPSALTLHLADIDAPHAPESTYTVNIVDGLKLLDTCSVDTYQGCIWLGVASKGNKRHMFQVQADHDGTLLADATAVQYSISVNNEHNGSIAIITLDVSLNGTGSAQVLRFRASTTLDGYIIKFRRIRIGKA
jgi:hypothetical protein